MTIYMILALFLLAVTKGIAVGYEESAAGYCEADDEETYSYHGYSNGPSKWAELFPACGGDSQSPIDINTRNVKMDNSLEKLSFFGYDTPVERADVVNEGHTVMITPRDNIPRGISSQGKDYNFQGLHFHWGSPSNPGAEHTINGNRFEMEAHFVHSSSDNKTAVVGVLIQMVELANPTFKPIVEFIPDVLYKDETTQLQSPLSLNEIIPESPASFYGYSGSLTSAVCTEGVPWFVLQRQQTIGKNQLDSFMKVYSVEEQDKSSECLLAPNNRPLQNLNGRIVYASQ